MCVNGQNVPAHGASGVQRYPARGLSKVEDLPAAPCEFGPRSYESRQLPLWQLIEPTELKVMHH